MADDGKLYIVITDKLEGGEIEPPNSAPTTTIKNSSSKTSASEKSMFEIIAGNQYAQFIFRQAKQFVNYNIQNVGNFTGDYIAQRRINETMQTLGIAATIGGAFAVAGPAGAILATAGIAVNAGYQSYAQRLENTRTNYNIDQLRRRSGLNVNLDGSRGTED